MKLKYFYIFILIIFVSVGHSIKAQQDSTEIKELSKIYNNLEYNTIAFNDLKKKWIISDPFLVREIFNRFIVNNAIRVKGRNLTQNEIEQKSQEIENGNILIDVRKRYYDNEIEFFAFLRKSELGKKNPKYFIDPVVDGFYLKKVLGNEMYSKIKNQEYFFYDITKDLYETRLGYYFNINLNLLNPDLMFWSTTSEFRNKYLLSFFGKWGEEYIFLPGWFAGEYIGGLRLTYHNDLSNNFNDYTYQVEFGTGFNAIGPFRSVLPKIPLIKTGKDIYFKISGQPLRYVVNGFDNFYVDIQSKFTLNTFKPRELSLSTPNKFSSVRDYAVFMLHKKKFFNLFDFGEFEMGLGISVMNHYNYQLDRKKNILLNEQAHKNWFDTFSHFGLAQVGVEKEGGLLQYSLDLLYGNNFDYKYSYVGVKSKIMLSNTFGFSFEFATSLNLNKTRNPYREDQYFVFSPIIRINY